jgi:hypothetical protein
MLKLLPYNMRSMAGRVNAWITELLQNCSPHTFAAPTLPNTIVELCSSHPVKRTQALLESNLRRDSRRGDE